MEIQANSRLLRLRLNDERTKKDTISTELALRITTVTKLKQRFESFSMALNPKKSNEDNIEPPTQDIIRV